MGNQGPPGPPDSTSVNIASVNVDKDKLYVILSDGRRLEVGDVIGLKSESATPESSTKTQTTEATAPATDDSTKLKINNVGWGEISEESKKNIIDTLTSRYSESIPTALDTAVQTKVGFFNDNTESTGFKDWLLKTQKQTTFYCSDGTCFTPNSEMEIDYSSGDISLKPRDNKKINLVNTSDIRLFNINNSWALQTNQQNDLIFSRLINGRVAQQGITFNKNSGALVMGREQPIITDLINPTVGNDIRINANIIIPRDRNIKIGDNIISGQDTATINSELKALKDEIEKLKPIVNTLQSNIPNYFERLNDQIARANDSIKTVLNQHIDPVKKFGEIDNNILTLSNKTNNDINALKNDIKDVKDNTVRTDRAYNIRHNRTGRFLRNESVQTNNPSSTGTLSLWGAAASGWLDQASQQFRFVYYPGESGKEWS